MNQAPSAIRHRVAAVVVNWNTCELLRECLTALTAPDGADWLQVVCIDNASGDGSTDMVVQEFPAVMLVRNDENVGFARAANQGIDLAMKEYEPDFVALVNSDALATPATLAALVAQLDRDAAVAAVAPALRHPDGRLQSGAAGFAPTAWSGVCHFLFLSALTRGLCRGVFIDQHHYVGRQRPLPVDWVSGACVAIRAHVIRRVGGLDSSFFMYAEDVEWFCRMRRAGYSIWYCPGLECVHHHGGSSRRANPTWIVALCQLVRDRRGALEFFVFRFAAAVGLGLRQVLYTLVHRAEGSDRHRKLAADMAVYARGAIRGRESGIEGERKQGA